MNESAKMKKMNFLLRNGPNYNLNACIGNNGGPYDFGTYAEGFFSSGFLLCENLEGFNRKIDILIYPIFFNFRHGIELFIKHLNILTNKLLQNDVPIIRSHKILDNWEHLSLNLEQILDFSEHLEISIVKDILIEFLEIDKTGQSFRYPTDIKGNRTLQEWSIINVEILKQGMEVIYNFFENCDMYISSLLDTNSMSASSS